MVRILPKRLLGGGDDDDPVEEVEDSLESVCDLLRLLARFLGLIPNDVRSRSNNPGWLQLNLTLDLLHYNKESDEKKKKKKKKKKKNDKKLDVKKKSKKKESSSSESSPEGKSGWFSKFRLHLDVNFTVYLSCVFVCCYMW